MRWVQLCGSLSILRHCLYLVSHNSVNEGMLPVISVNKGCFSHQAITLSWPPWWAWRKLRIETGCLPSASQSLHPPQVCTLRTLRVRKHRVLSPDTWDTYQNDFNELRVLHLLYIGKHYSLTWHVWFSLVMCNLWCSEYLVFVTKSLIYPGSFLPSLEIVLKDWSPGIEALRLYTE